MKTEKKNFLVKASFVALLLILVAIEISYAILKFDQSLYMLMSRFAGGSACLLFMIEFSFTRILSPMGNKKPLLWLLTIPGFVIAINNFPFVSFLAGDCQITAKTESIMYFALICLGVGFFEEMAFRGCAFMLLLKSKTQSRAKIFLAIFLSSVVFGCIHVVNLFFGGSVGSVVLQIGYSALIGALCSMVLLLTGNIWLCVLLHAAYNFCGGIISDYGIGVQWTSAEIVFTAVVSVIVAVYFVILFIKMPTSLAEDLFKKKVSKNEEIEK